MIDERRPHFYLNNTKKSYPYQAPSGGGRDVLPPDRDLHAHKLFTIYSQVIKNIQQQRAINAAIRERGGSYLEFTANKDLFIPSKFEDNTQGIKLLNVKTISEDLQKATVYIPEVKDSYYPKKIEEYASHEKDGVNPKNQEKLKSIKDINISTFEDLWLDGSERIPTIEKKWCEIWIDTEIKKKYQPTKDFLRICHDLRIETSLSSINFPDRVVYLVLANRADLENLIDSFGYICEIHEFHEPGDFFIDLKPLEKKEWTDDFLSRTVDSENKIRVCILDNGVSFNHPLLKGVTNQNEIQAIDPTWNISDSQNPRPHGTRMAGLCEYFDLQEKLTSKDTFVRKIQIESVKILPDYGKNKKDLYGAITQDAVNIAEATVHSDNRVHCMAVTEDEKKSTKGKPSSWSASLDNLISGYEDNKQKLFIVSAGNTNVQKLIDEGYPNATLNSSIQSPAQSWNSLTVGAAAIHLLPIKKDMTLLAQPNDLCPYSTTSLDWETRWPIKPEVLFDGGNAVKDVYGGVYRDGCLITTCEDAQTFAEINATSSATAQASNVAAELLSINPFLWPETVRALIVNSARWPEIACKRYPEKWNRTILLRTFGYGIASKERTINSYSHNAVMVIEDTIQPFVSHNGNIVANEMNIHELPWPKDFLLGLAAEPVQIKITLSYFIEAAPDSKGWVDKFKYQSAGLRFELKKSSETPKDFMQRINKLLRDEDYENDNAEDKWFLGPKKRNVGSLHSDYWIGTAAELAECSSIAIVPVSGWWKFKKQLGRYNKTMRYSLVVSLETKNKEIDIYNAVKTIIDTQIETSVTTTV